MKNKKLPLIIKLLLIQSIFLILHYLYDWFPNSLTTFFSGINESVYQHMKIGFFTYILYGIFEFLITKKSIQTLSSHVYSRLFSTTYFPLVMMPIYLLGPLLFGHTENMLLEIIFANIALLGTSFSTLVLEDHIEKSKLEPSFRVVIIALFLISLVQFVVFTYRLPWFDIFAIPPGY